MTERPRPGVPGHVDEDLLLDLALGHAGRSEREAATAHLAVCAACRRDYDELAGVVDLVLPAVPRLSPPPGFEARVLARLDAVRGAPAEPAPAEQPPSERAPTAAAPTGVRRRTVLWAAAAALAGAVAGAGVTAYLDREEEPDLTWASALLTADGTRVGLVSRSHADGGPVLVVEVSDGPAGRAYTCRLVMADGSTEDVATWSLAADRPNSWVVRLPAGGEVTAVELVAEQGKVWSTARL